MCERLLKAKYSHASGDISDHYARARLGVTGGYVSYGLYREAERNVTP